MGNADQSQSSMIDTDQTVDTDQSPTVKSWWLPEGVTPTKVSINGSGPT